MLAIDHLIGGRLDEILPVQSPDAEDHSWTGSVVFQFQSIHCIIDVNGDTDELKVLFEGHNQLPDNHPKPTALASFAYPTTRTTHWLA